MASNEVDRSLCPEMQYCLQSVSVLQLETFKRDTVPQEVRKLIAMNGRKCNSGTVLTAQNKTKRRHKQGEKTC